MDFKYLHYFWATARAGGVMRAGEQLHITPQTLSGQIKLLEERLGCALFRKSGRRLELPEVDLEQYRARIEQRTRSAFDGEMFSLDQVAADYSGLPDLTADADEAQVDSFVAAFLQTLSIEDRLPADEVTL